MDDRPYSRRTFLKLSTAAAAGLSISAAPNHRDMPHRILGRTANPFLCSAWVARTGRPRQHGGEGRHRLDAPAIDEGINSLTAWATPTARAK